MRLFIALAAVFFSAAALLADAAGDAAAEVLSSAEAQIDGRQGSHGTLDTTNQADAKNVARWTLGR